MLITLNGQASETQQSTLEAFLVEQGYVDCSIATAVNDQFIAQANRKTTTLNDNDVIEVVAPMQGG